MPQSPTSHLSNYDSCFTHRLFSTPHHKEDDLKATASVVSDIGRTPNPTTIKQSVICFQHNDEEKDYSLKRNFYKVQSVSYKIPQQILRFTKLTGLCPNMPEIRYKRLKPLSKHGTPQPPHDRRG